MKERQILFSGPMVRALLEDRKGQTRRVMKKQPYISCSNPPNVSDAETGDIFICPDYFPTSEVRGNVIVECTGIGVYHCMGQREFAEKHSPYGVPGDRLWVREAWRTVKDLDPHSGSEIAELCLNAGYRLPWAPIQYEADGTRAQWEHTSTPPHAGEPLPGRYRHARFMPRWASRLTLDVAGIRVERLQDISETDAIAEGVEPPSSERDEHDWGICPRCGGTGLYDAIGPNLGVMPDTDCTKCDTHAKRYRHLWESINGEGSWDVNPWVWVVEFKRVQP